MDSYVTFFTYLPLYLTYLQTIYFLTGAIIMLILQCFALHYLKYFVIPTFFLKYECEITTAFLIYCKSECVLFLYMCVCVCVCVCMCVRSSVHIAVSVSLKYFRCGIKLFIIGIMQLTAETSTFLVRFLHRSVVFNI
jgi:hypothetical protein